jgi:hypothetical protein
VSPSDSPTSYLSSKGFHFRQDGGEIFGDSRMDVHGALDDRVGRLCLHGVQQNVNYFIASHPENCDYGLILLKGFATR